MRIRHIVSNDYPEWLRLRNLLWPGSPDDHEREIAEFFMKPNPDLATFVIAGGGTLGLSEMASDCEIDNVVSFCAHTALGYEEVERIICFRQTLESNASQGHDT